VLNTCDEEQCQTSLKILTNVIVQDDNKDGVEKGRDIDEVMKIIKCDITFIYYRCVLNEFSLKHNNFI